MIIELNSWIYSETGHFAILEATIGKDINSRTRVHNILVWSILDPTNKLHGRAFIVEPERTHSLTQRIERETYNSIEDARPDAERMFAEYLSKIESGEINWWTRKPRKEKK